MKKDELIAKIIESGILKSKSVIAAFQKIDRADFVLKKYRDEVYEDYPLPIGYGQTISQPSTVAFMLELLDPQEGEKILDVGSGSGWTTALMAHIVGSTGKVWGLERVPELVEFGCENLAKYKFSNAQILQTERGLLAPRLPTGDFAGFDKILVSAAGESLPQELVGQLKVGGRMVIPIGNSIFKIDKTSESEIKKQEFPGFVFVPLKRG